MLYVYEALALAESEGKVYLRLKCPRYANEYIMPDPFTLWVITCHKLVLNTRSRISFCFGSIRSAFIFLHYIQVRLYSTCRTFNSL